MCEFSGRRSWQRRWLATALLAFCTIDASAQSAVPYPQGAQPRAVRLMADEAALRIDGRLDEAVWRRAPVHDAFVQYLPLDKLPAPAAYRTTLQVVVDDGGLSFGIRAFDPRPDEIVAPLTRRDKVARDQDFVNVVLDAVGTRRSAQFVRVNAAGVVADGMFIADTDTEDFSPDFEVEAAVQRLSDGYSVELRLPLLALRYPYEGGAPWRLMVARSIPRADSTLLLSAPLSKDALNFIAELQEIDGLQDIAERVRAHSLLSLRPELTLRSTRHSETSGTRRSRNASLGAEIKWRPRADLVFDATLNPDFSQVELDTPQLAGNTQFALSVPEKRPFFLESTDVLDLPLAAFYSRAVTDPRLGLRATWRGLRADATALSLSDEGGGLILLPGPFATGLASQDERSQATLLRGRVHAGELTAGALVSLRDYAGGRSNRVAGADLVWRASDEEQVRVRALGSMTTALLDTNGDVAQGAREDGHHLFVSWWRRVPGWNFTAEASQTSPRFRNDNGFVEQAGVRHLQAEVIRRWGEVALPGFTAYEFETFVWTEERRTLADAGRAVAGGETVTRRVHPGIWLVAARNTEAWLRLHLDAERAAAGRRLHPVRQVAGGYGVNPAPWFTRFTAELEVGERLDVVADRVGRGAEWLLEAKLRAGLPNGYGLESEQRIAQGFINRPEGGRALTDTAMQWLGVLHFNARDSLRAVVQHVQYRHAADAGAALAADSWRNDVASLVFQRRVGLGRSFSIGASSQRTRANQALSRDRELFAKLAIELDR
jgi:hypothetical protein